MPQSQASSAADPPAKKQSKWSAEEDALIIELRGSGMKWDDISKRLPGRSPISCRLHYQNYLEKRSEWDEERKNKLARLYERFKPEMWAKVAEEMQVPWRAAEAMHWHLGEADMARRAGVTPFLLQTSGTEGTQALHRTSPSRGHGHSPSYSTGLLHGIHSPRYGRTPVPGAMSAHGPPPGHGHGGGAVPPPPYAAISPPMSGSARIAARRDSVPPRHHHHHHHYQHHLQPPSPSDTYSMSGPGLPPIQPGAPGQGRGGMLPGVAELTTGISPYSTPAYSLSVPTTSPAASSTASPGPGASGQSLPPLSSSYYRQSPPLPPHQYHYQQQQQQQQQPPQPPRHYEPAPSSTAAGKRRASPEVMARETSRRRHLDPQARQQHDDGDSSGSQRTR